MSHPQLPLRTHLGGRGGGACCAALSFHSPWSRVTHRHHSLLAPTMGQSCTTLRVPPPTNATPSGSQLAARVGESPQRVTHTAFGSRTCEKPSHADSSTRGGRDVVLDASMASRRERYQSISTLASVSMDEPASRAVSVPSQAWRKPSRPWIHGSCWQESANGMVFHPPPSVRESGEAASYNATNVDVEFGTPDDRDAAMEVFTHGVCAASGTKSVRGSPLARVGSLNGFVAPSRQDYPPSKHAGITPALTLQPLCQVLTDDPRCAEEAHRDDCSNPSTCGTAAVALTFISVADVVTDESHDDSHH